jgi:hypothetical protein
MQGEEYDEATMMREAFKDDRDPAKDHVDHKDDETFFDITIVNKRDMAINVDCSVRNGEI